jgi:hypothetical protein
MKSVREIELRGEKGKEHSNRMEDRLGSDKKADSIRLPPFEVFETNKFPIQVNTPIAKKEVEIEADIGLKCVQVANIEESADAVMKDIQLSNVPMVSKKEQSTERMQVQDESKVSDMEQRMNMLEVQINLIAEDNAIIITEAKDYDYLNHLDNKCIQLEQLMRTLLPCIAFGNLSY